MARKVVDIETFVDRVNELVGRLADRAQTLSYHKERLLEAIQIIDEKLPDRRTIETLMPDDNVAGFRSYPIVLKDNEILAFRDAIEEVKDDEVD